MALNWQTEFYRYRRYFMGIRRFYGQKKVRVYTEIVLSILTTAFFLFFAIKPTLVTITGLIKEIKDKKLVIQKLEEKIHNLNLAKEKYFAIQKDSSLIDQALPKDSQISLLVRQLEALAVKSGVSLEAIQYSPINFKGDGNGVKASASVIEFKMFFQGDYQNLRNFLLSLNNFRRIIQVEGFGFKKGKEGEGLSLSLNGKAFFLKGEK